MQAKSVDRLCFGGRRKPALPLLLTALLLPAIHGAASSQTRPAPPKPAPSPVGIVSRASRNLSAITSLAYSPDGKRLAVGAYGQVLLYDAETWQLIGRYSQAEDFVRSLSFHPDGKILAIGDGLPAVNGKVTLWDTSGTAKPRMIGKHKDNVEAVAFGPNGKSLIFGANDNKARYCDNVDVEGVLLDQHNGRVQAVAISPRPDFIYITGAADKIVKVWDMGSGKSVVNFDQAQAPITGLVFLPGGTQFIGSSADGRLYWWSVGYNREKKTFSGGLNRQIVAHENGVDCLGISADGKRIISGGEDNNVIVWTADGGRVRLFSDSKRPVYAAALNPTGKIAAAGGRDGLLRIYDVDANKLIATLPTPPLPPKGK